MTELSQDELSVYFWLKCLNFKLVELSLAELSVRRFVNRSKIYLFVLNMACGGMIFIKKFSN